MKIISLFLLFIFAITTEVISQVPTPCESGNCTGNQSNWTTEQTPIVGDTNECGFLVYYSWRICDGTPPIREVEISRIELLNGGNCNATTNSAIINQAVKAILSSSAAIFNESSGYPFNVTVKIPGCVRRSVINGLLAINNYGCSSVCCENSYSMIYENGAMICLSQTNNQTQISCSSPIGETCGSNCSDMTMPLNTPLFAQHFNTNWDCSSEASDCPNMISLGIKTAIYTSPNRTISLLVNYMLRQCATGYYEMQVINIQIVRGFNWLEYEWVRYGYRAVLNQMCLLNGVPAIYTIGIYVKPCWTSQISSNIIYNITRCLSPNYCCYRKVRVSCIENKIIFDEPAIISGGNVDCVTYGCGLWLCNVVSEFSRNTGALPKQIIEFDNINLNDLNTYLVYPNPTKNILNIIGHSEIKGNLIITIYNILGEIMHLKSFTKNSFDFNEMIDISNLPVGTYSYKILVGENYSSGKFILGR